MSNEIFKNILFRWCGDNFCLDQMFALVIIFGLESPTLEGKPSSSCVEFLLRNKVFGFKKAFLGSRNA